MRVGSKFDSITEAMMPFAVTAADRQQSSFARDCLLYFVNYRA